MSEPRSRMPVVITIACLFFAFAFASAYLPTHPWKAATGDTLRQLDSVDAGTPLSTGGDAAVPRLAFDGQGNALLVGIEAENDGVGEPWPSIQLVAMVRATAAVLDLLGQPRSNVWGHREYTPRKIDPAGITMAQFRADVAAARPPGATTVPTPDPVKASQQRLNDSGAKPPLVLDGVWGPACDAALDAVLKYQQGQMADLRKANATSADTITRLGAERDFHMTTAKRLEGERDTAVANREAAEAEVAQLRASLNAHDDLIIKLRIERDAAYVRGLERAKEISEVYFSAYDAVNAIAAEIESATPRTKAGK